MSQTNSIILVVPCYNEAARLDVHAFLDFLDVFPGINYLFVNDGSTDDTGLVIDDLSTRRGCVHTLHLETNSGKAEAVRQGMIGCCRGEYSYAGYWDADLSTPLQELPSFWSLLDTNEEINIVTGARIKMVGRRIERNPFRHYFGRVFATAVSVLFGIQMYDTQCGAKLFRVQPEIAALFDEPFHTRWVFDVELFVRYSLEVDIHQKLIELPLSEWRDVQGSKMRPLDFLRAPIELLRIHNAYRKS
ncbi:MAG: glycosyltransferase [Candidatus Latescibacterota bacterium]|nr:glycosyltransferase [Candidatus Latescibacterota bacterium]